MSDEMEKEWNEFVNGNRELICGFEDALVMAFNAGWFAGKQEAVRLASESVDLERLRKYCKEEIRRCYGDSELDQVEINALTKIQEWAEKEAKKK